MANYINEHVNRHRLTDIFNKDHPKKYDYLKPLSQTFLAQKKESTKEIQKEFQQEFDNKGNKIKTLHKPHYITHYKKVRRDLTYSPKELANALKIYDLLAKSASLAEQITELEEQGDLEKTLKDARQRAKLMLPKKIYDLEPMQKHLRKINAALNYFKR
jgi:ribosomal protein S25